MLDIFSISCYIINGWVFHPSRTNQKRKELVNVSMSDFKEAFEKREYKGYSIETTVDDWYDIVEIFSASGEMVYEDFGYFSEADKEKMVDNICK